MPDAVYLEWWNNTWRKGYSYDSLGRLYRVITKAGSEFVNYIYEYKTVSGNRTSTQVSSLETAAGTFSYTYDNRGNITSVSDGTYTTTYTYDDLDQLKREDNEKNNRTYVYEYSNGNLLSRSAYEYTDPDVTPTGVLHVYNLEYTAYTWKDLLVKYDGVSMAYDGNGQITSFNGMSMSWDYLGLLGSAGSTTYTYDTSGRRLSKTTNGTETKFYYAGDLLVGQKTGNNTLEFIYDSNGDYYGFLYNDVPYNYIKNLQGDVIAIADGSANILVRYEYDAWGRLISSTDTSGINIGTINPIRYRGYYYDTETGLYYVSSRYYDPEIGRFINADTTDILTATPMGLTDKNLFAYCDNNPVVRVDHGGQFWDTVFDVISLGASIVEVCVNPTDPWAWAGLAGDAIDLIPFVTGVGEVTRAVKTIDKVADTVQIAKAVDFTDDAADIVKTLDRSSGFTKSTASAGRKIHAGYKATDNFSSIGKEYRRINGIRPDYIDFNTRTIYELKPMNPRGVRSGIRQLQKYNKALGGGFNLRLELY